MDSKDTKDLLVVNLTAVLAISTFPLLPNIDKNSSINPIVLAYWVFFALLLLAYLCEGTNEERRKQNPSLRVNYKYYEALRLNLVCLVMSVLALVFFSKSSVPLIISSLFLLLLYIIEVMLIFSYIRVTLFDSGFHSFKNFIISYYRYIEDKIDSPIKLVTVAILFESVVISIYFLVHS